MYNVHIATLFSSNRIYICAGLCACCHRPQRPLHSCTQRYISCQWTGADTNTRHDQTDVISDLNHECKKRKLGAVCSVFQTRKHNNTTSRIRFPLSQRTATIHTAAPFPLSPRYIHCQWNIATGYRSIIIIMAYSVTLPDTTKEKLTMKLYPRILWMIGNV